MCKRGSTGKCIKGCPLLGGASRMPLPVFRWRLPQTLSRPLASSPGTSVCPLVTPSICMSFSNPKAFLSLGFFLHPRGIIILPALQQLTELQKRKSRRKCFINHPTIISDSVPLSVRLFQRLGGYVFSCLW